MRKIIFITPHDAEFGFSMAGVIQHAINKVDVEEVIKKAITEKDSGVIIIDERLTKGIDMERLREMEERWKGVLLILPAPERIGEEEDYAVRLIRKAIGYHVRLNL